MSSGTESRGAVPPAALLLSGGGSQRFGGAAKALLKVRGEFAVRRMAALAIAQSLSPVVLVVRPKLIDVLESVAGLPVVVRPSERCALGRSASIQEGLGAIPPDRDVLLWPVDHPFVHARTLQALLEARAKEPFSDWIIPTFDGRDGHPVVFSRKARSSIRALRPGDSLRIVRDRFHDRTIRVAVSDPGVIEAIDTPEAYARASDREERWIDA